MAWVSVVARLLLAAVFTVAAASKLADQPGTRDTLRQFGVSDRLVRSAAVLLPASELAVAIGLLFRPVAVSAAVAAAVLLLVFSAAMERVIREGKSLACRCFGALSAEPVTRATIGRNAALIVVAAAVLVRRPVALDGWLSDRSAAELVALALGAWALLATIACFVLWRRARRSSVEAPEVGTRAPGFSLSDVDGRKVDSDSIITPGLPHLLAFVSENCPHCDELLPDLARWQDTLDERLPIVVLGSGDRKHHVEVARQYGLRNVYAQKDFEVADAFGVRGTPSAVLIDADGNVASEPLAGAIAVEAVVRYALSRTRRSADASAARDDRWEA
jgi:peroxiredoxin/uncharacterized membrane protein YphA (DoxX/SURF4 family)